VYGLLVFNDVPCGIEARHLFSRLGHFAFARAGCTKDVGMIFLRKCVVGAAHSRLRGPRLHAERSVGVCERVSMLAWRSASASRAPPLLADAPFDPAAEKRSQESAEQTAPRTENRSGEWTDPEHQMTFPANSSNAGISISSAAPASIDAANDGSTGSRTTSGIPNFFAIASALDSPNTGISLPQSGHFR